MSVLPSHLKYAQTHEWAYVDEDGNVVVGITDFAQEALGELMSVTFPELGMDVTQGDDIMSLESVKAASDIYAPVSGEVIAINEALEDEPELINDEPYDGGWLFKIAPNDVSELEDLMSDEEYQEQIDNE
ncbi:glycine cleavage system protein GcvH [Thiomicrorhabdus aquaedulcis]|uniref:glycine cleavage system protein GcvH n=1 Tax=Thiomicrorhabdus aquaedulcis TaxID=2211106 RepID=UPI000FD712BF|nr:glycine cleavage system protein GcvH [Thiomicrorhabdus aquaedulcis]